jgi:hypothetical protein
MAQPLDHMFYGYHTDISTLLTQYKIFRYFRMLQGCQKKSLCFLKVYSLFIASVDKNYFLAQTAFEGF